ncbi:hypothetical protein [Bacillus ndiopicus]|uniref:hypothetical protein n=1 Tax=Bacillus ndiopicus TaxID=1347368 RepID=UPI0005A9F793|nr:hypothetical protein [Bacillus ndiopicus]
MSIKTFSQLEGCEIELLESYWINRKKIREELQAGNKPKEFVEYHEKLLAAMNVVYPKMSEEIRTVINMRYRDRDSWAEIADEIYSTIARTKELANVALRELAIQLGWIYF